MPRIKKPPQAPSSSLGGYTIAFTDTKKVNIPLHHTELANKTFNQLEEAIEEAGGSVVTKIEAGTCTHLVCSPEQYQKSGARVKSAIQHNIPILDYDWLVASLGSTDAVNEANFSLHQSTDASSPSPINVPQTTGTSKKRVRDDEDDDQDTVTKRPKAKVDSQILNDTKPAQKPKTRVPVDEKYTDQRCEVYQNEDGVFLDATMNQTQSGKNANKFYRAQVLKHADGSFYAWTRWGRVGENGQNKILGDGSMDVAVKEFEKKFKDKTGHLWTNRNDPPKSGKYVMLEIKYEESDEDDGDLPGAGSRRGSKDTYTSTASSETESKLPKATAELMSLIFNNDYFSSTLADLEYDANKMPLGKLSKKTVLQGNAYFSLIPHAYGRNRVPVLSRMNMIKKEVELLETLTDMQLANEIMNTAKNDKLKQEEKVAMADRQYEGLGMQEMTPLDHKSNEYKELEDYLVKSAGKTHYIKYKVEEIFRIERQGEGSRFKSSKFGRVPESKSDRRLLWHGSRTTNYGGILSQGLRIAPPEAPVTGTMFGKGVYLADISTKSANYCVAHYSGNTALLLLCEAELGTPSLKLSDAAPDAGEQAAKQGCISTWGVGQTTPKGWKDAGCVHPELEGVTMPDVKDEPGPSNEPGAWLQYNEFICYAVEQVRLRYLLRVNMGGGY